MRASTASHHAPLRICMPLALHAALACPRFRMPRSHAAWRFRTRTHHPTTPHHASRQSQPHSAHSHFAFRISHSTIIPTLTSRAHTRPHHKTAAQHATSPNHRCAASACLQTASQHRNQQAHSRKPSQLNVTPPSSSSSHPPHATLPLTCHPFGTALHSCCRACLPPTHAPCPHVPLSARATQRCCASAQVPCCVSEHQRPGAC